MAVLINGAHPVSFQNHPAIRTSVLEIPSDYAGENIKQESIFSASPLWFPLKIERSPISLVSICL